MTLPPNEADEPEMGSAAILPLLSGKGDQKLLRDWIEGHETYTLVDATDAIETAEFDCCILDGEALQEHAAVLQERKQEAEPVLLPCLLLMPEADISVLDVDRGEIADGVMFQTVDEVVSMPIKKAELEWRTKALLRLRSQSLRLSRKQTQLRQLKRATEAAGHAVYITDADGRIEYVNPAFEEMTGYDAAEALGKTPRILDSGEMSQTYFDRLWETVSRGHIWKEDIINRRKDGELYHAFQTIAPLMDETNTPSKFVAIQSDISQRVEAEQRLELFEDIVERVDDPIMLQDRDGQFRLVNEALTEYAAMSREDLLGETEHAFMDKESARRIETRKNQVIGQEQPVQYTISPTFPNITGEIFSTVRYPYYGQDGDIEGTIAICRNVTELQSREGQLRVLDRVLRHNLRNDMTTIGMFSEKLSEMASGDQATYADRIHATSEKLNKLIEKERKITKFLTAEQEETELDFAGLVDSVVDEMTENHPEADITCDIPETCPVYATAALEEAIEELLENAIVHSDQETPSIDVALERCADAPTLVVADDGPGIPEMDRKVLTRGTAIEQLYHGSGLGLWLVHLIVTHSGGTVTFTENDPRGSIVTIEFEYS